MRQVLSNVRQPRADCVVVEFTQSFEVFVRIMNEVRQVDIGDLILREDMMHEATGKKRENATGELAIGKSLATGLGEGQYGLRAASVGCEKGGRKRMLVGKMAGSLPEKHQEEHMGKRPSAAINWRAT